MAHGRERRRRPVVGGRRRISRRGLSRVDRPRRARFEIVHCRPTPDRASAAGHGCHVAYGYDELGGLVERDGFAAIPPDAFPPRVPETRNAIVDGAAAAAWSLDRVTDLRGAAVEAVDARIFVGAALLEERSLAPENSGSVALVVYDVVDATAPPRTYDATCASVRVTTRRAASATRGNPKKTTRRTQNDKMETAKNDTGRAARARGRT